MRFLCIPKTPVGKSILFGHLTRVWTTGPQGCAVKPADTGCDGPGHANVSADPTWSRYCGVTCFSGRSPTRRQGGALPLLIGPGVLKTRSRRRQNENEHLDPFPRYPIPRYTDDQEVSSQALRFVGFGLGLLVVSHAGTAGAAGSGTMLPG